MAWPRRWACRKPPCHASGERSRCNRIASNPLSSQLTHSLSKRSATFVGLYLNPPDRAMVPCVDEKSQAQGLDRTRSVLPLCPGVPERQTHDYIRYGTTSLFAALDIATGKVIGSCHRRHRHQELLRLLQRIDATIPAGQHLVMDNYGAHKVSKVQRWFVKHPKSITCISSPLRPVGSTKWNSFLPRSRTSASGAALSASVRQLDYAIQDYLAHHNRDCKPFVWSADADLILAKVRHFYEANF